MKDVLHQEEAGLYPAENWGLLTYFKQDGVLETVCLEQQGAGSASHTWIDRDFAGNACNTSGKINSRNWYQRVALSWRNRGGRNTIFAVFLLHWFYFSRRLYYIF